MIAVIAIKPYVSGGTIGARMTVMAKLRTNGPGFSSPAQKDTSINRIENRLDEAPDDA